MDFQQYLSHKIPSGRRGRNNFERTGSNEERDGPSVRGLGYIFKSTPPRPPTALIIDEAPRVFAALVILAWHDIKAPEHVSLACSDSDAMEPGCHRDTAPIARSMMHRESAVGKGKHGCRSNGGLATR